MLQDCSEAPVSRHGLPRLAGARNAVTVCETLQNALAKITGAPVHLTGCGWTDVSSMYCAARTGISRRCAWAGPS